LFSRSRWIAAVLILTSAFIGWLILGSNGRHTDSASPATPPALDLAALADLGNEEAFAPLSGPWQLSLPADHGAHSQTRSESWLLSGTLTTAREETIGFQLGLLRFALIPEAARAEDSRWRAGEVYRAHLLLANTATGETAGAERYSRAAIGLAGHDTVEQRVWLENWTFEYGIGEGGEQLRMEASLEDATVELTLEPRKAALAGDQEQGGAPFRSYALTRLEGSGVIRSASADEPVTASAWLEHLWGDVPLPLGPIVWDRVMIQLDEGSEVLVLRTRRRNGSGQPTLSGFRRDARGTTTALTADSTRFTPSAEYWWDEQSGIRYPLSWLLTTADLELRIEPILEDQVHDFTIPFWGGLISVSGRSGGERVSGTGFLELTGYEAAP
jgi:predicted secreted hydrolase